jgi:uncharacterized membrane protein
MSLLSIANALHLLAAVLWVGGMFFAYMALRPAAGGLDPAIKGPLWEHALRRFFPWVWVSILILLATGYWMLFDRFGGFAHAPLYVHIMHAVGLSMILLFFHVFFAPYRRLGRTNALKDFAASAKQLAQIRRMVAINLGLGIIVVLVVGAGRFWIG